MEDHKYEIFNSISIPTPTTDSDELHPCIPLDYKETLLKHLHGRPQI